MNLVYLWKVTQFAAKHPEAVARLKGWVRTMKQLTAQSLSELKKTYRRCDYVPKRFTIFDVGGTSYRIVTIIDYRTQTVYIDSLLTHAEYDQWTRKNRRT